MQDRTINSALLALRKQGGQQGMLAEVILGMRGIDLPHVKFYPPMQTRAATRIVLTALRDLGPSTATDMDHVLLKEFPELNGKRAYNRAYLALTRLLERGLIVRDGKVWSRQ